MVPVRLKLGIVAGAVLGLGRYVLPWLAPDLSIYSILGGVACGITIFVWWLFFSRAAIAERIFAAAWIAAGFVITPRVLDPSVATGLQGMLLPIFGIPVVSGVLVLWAIVTRRVESRNVRLATMAAVLTAAFAGFALVRTDGVIGDADSQFAWRWTPTHEGKLAAVPAPLPPQPTPLRQVPLAVVAAETASKTAASPAERAQALRPPSPVPVLWAGFRGPARDGVVRGAAIASDWSQSAPRELWRRAVGPGWSSFAVRRDLIYTQEQRGDMEMVAAYRLSGGEPVWMHRDPARFWESNAGAGPRGTPSLSADGARLYSVGATGILNALDAPTGGRLWTRNIAADTGARLPGWGFASSPVVMDELSLVVVAASGRMAAYDALSGERRWVVNAGGGSYSSPHRITVDGVAQLVLLSGEGATGVSPADGKALWKHAWPGATMLQPAALSTGGDLLITTGSDSGGGVGTRRLSLSRDAGGWTARELWTSSGLKPYFNDLVVHKGHAYGFDGSILSCISVEDGQRKWKGGRYGHGQMLLLADQDVLLVLSEEGELALVAAAPDQFKELARAPALNGKTWNHPALLNGNLLLVRNAEEMAALQLPAR